MRNNSKYLSLFFIVMFVLSVHSCKTEEVMDATSKFSVSSLASPLDSAIFNGSFVVDCADNIKWKIKSNSSGSWVSLLHKVNGVSTLITPGEAIYKGRDTIQITVQKNLGTPDRTAIVNFLALNPDSSVFKVLDYYINQKGSSFFNPSGGTIDNPYLITTVDQLLALAANVNSGTSYAGLYFKQMNNIDLSSVSNWTPIGVVANPFMGNYDGQSFEIQNIKISKSTKGYQGVGFFGVVKGTSALLASVSNVTVKGSGAGTDIVATVGDGASSTTIGGGVAGVIGIAQAYANVTGCKNYAYVSGGASSVGGVIGHIGTPTGIIGGWTPPSQTDGSTVTVSKSFNYGTVEVTLPNNHQNGGFVGCNLGGHIKWCANLGTFYTNTVSRSGGFCGYNNGIVEECYNSGSIKGSEAVPTANAYGQAGVVVYLGNNGIVRNCYNAGTIFKNDASIGGIIGTIQASISSFTVQNCYNAGQVQLTSGGAIGNFQTTNAALVSSVSSCYALSGNLATKLISQNAPAGISDTQIKFLTTSQAKAQASFSGWDFTTVWQIQEGATYPTLRNNPPQ